jgi:hypothetical protein
MTLSTSDSTFNRLQGHQTDAAASIGASDSFQTAEGSARLENNVKNTHGAISTASFAAVRAALTNRGTASAKLQQVSLTMAAHVNVGAARYRGTDSTAGDDLNNQML